MEPRWSLFVGSSRPSGTAAGEPFACGRRVVKPRVGSRRLNQELGGRAAGDVKPSHGTHTLMRAIRLPLKAPSTENPKEERIRHRKGPVSDCSGLGAFESRVAPA